MSDSGEEIDEESLDSPVAPNGAKRVARVATVAKKASAVKAKIIAGKEANTDIRAKYSTVLCNFYKNGEKIILELPKLPPISTGSTGNRPDDYSDYNSKMSSWYTGTERKFKISNKPVPFPKKQYQCDFKGCNWSFQTATRLHRHREIHMDNGVFACQMCNSLFNHQYNIYMHWRNSCPPLANRKTDADVTNGKAKNVRSFVLCMMGIENRAQQFHVFGGVIFIPSKAFLNDPITSNHPSYMAMCYLCSLHVPTKFIECHGDVHRGRFRIDGAIYGDYLCHICAEIFTSKANLLTHWRTSCEEVKAYTSTEHILNDEEMAALAWLVMQQTIPEKHIFDMNPNSMQMVERWAQQHSIKNGLQGLFYNGGYYHYPQEIWPLCIPSGHDLINDALPIRGKNICETPTEEEQQAFQVHRVNLMAQMCPEFYATGMSFTQITSSPTDASKPKGVYKVILRYTIENSVIKTYTFNEKSCPRLKANSLAWDNEYKELKCARCNSKTTALSNLFFASPGRLKAHTDNHKGQTCKICHRYLFLRSKAEHWQNECEPLAQLFPDIEDRKYVTEEFSISIVMSLKNCRLKVIIEDLTAPSFGLESKKTSQKQTKDSIGNKVRVTFESLEGTVEDNLAKARRHVNMAYMVAKTNYENLHKKTVPTAAPTVVCPHCGGIFHNAVFLTHLVNRHNYAGQPRDREKALDAWRKSGFKNTTEVFTSLMEECTTRYDDSQLEDHIDRATRPLPALLSPEQYERCREAYKTGYQCAPFDFPWYKDKTYREVIIAEPLEFTEIERIGSTVAPEPCDTLEQIFPESVKTDVPEDFLGSNGVVWRAPDSRVKAPTRDLVDPQTGVKVRKECVQMVEDVNAQFMGDFLLESLTNGIDIISITEFFPRSMGNPKALSNTDADLAMQESATDEKLKQCLQDDALLQWYNSDEDEKNNGIDGMASGSGVKLKADESDLLRMKKVWEAREEMKAKAKTAPPPEPYNKEDFRPEVFMLDPMKADELQYLTNIEEDDEGSEDDEEAEGRLLPFSLKYEKRWSDFRDNGTRFMKTCLKQHQSNGWVKSITINNSEKSNAFPYEELDNGTCDTIAVVDTKGIAYLGGFIHDTPLIYRDRQTFFTFRGEDVKKMRVFYCEDARGKFYWFWPVEEGTGLEKQEDLSVKRVKIKTYKHIKSNSKVMEDEPSSHKRKKLAMKQTKELAMNRAKKPRERKQRKLMGVDSTKHKESVTDTKDEKGEMADFDAPTLEKESEYSVRPMKENAANTDGSERKLVSSDDPMKQKKKSRADADDLMRKEKKKKKKKKARADDSTDQLPISSDDLMRKEKKKKKKNKKSRADDSAEQLPISSDDLMRKEKKKKKKKARADDSTEQLPISSDDLIRKEKKKKKKKARADDSAEQLLISSDDLMREEKKKKKESRADESAEQLPISSDDLMRKEKKKKKKSRTDDSTEQLPIASDDLMRKEKKKKKKKARADDSAEQLPISSDDLMRKEKKSRADDSTEQLPISSDDLMGKEKKKKKKKARADDSAEQLLIASDDLMRKEKKKKKKSRADGLTEVSSDGLIRKKKKKPDSDPPMTKKPDKTNLSEEKLPVSSDIPIENDKKSETDAPKKGNPTSDFLGNETPAPSENRVKETAETISAMKKNMLDVSEPPRKKKKKEHDDTDIRKIVDIKTGVTDPGDASQEKPEEAPPEKTPEVTEVLPQAESNVQNS